MSRRMGILRGYGLRLARWLTLHCCAHDWAGKPSTGYVCTRCDLFTERKR